MSNPYPTGYPSVPVSSGLINSPHSFSGSPGPMSNVIGQGMSNMTPNMASVIPNMSAMNSGMGGGINNAMGGGMGGIGRMSPSMNSVLSSGLGSTMGPGLQPQMSGGMSAPHSTAMSPGMGTGMQHQMPNMQGALGGNMTSGLNSGLTPGMVSGMSPMAMQYAMVPSQPPNQQSTSALVQAATPTGASNAVNCDGNNSVSGAVASGRLSAPGDGSVAPQSSRDINTASLCRIGQETVQDIISRTQEIFQTLKTMQAPNGTAAGANAANEKKRKVQEQLRTIRILFKRLRLIYEKCNDNSQLQGMEYTHIESLIPLKDEWDGKSEERKSSESYRQAIEEHRELIEAVVTKNRVLKDIIDHMRRIIWEINTMLMMRRS